MEEPNFLTPWSSNNNIHKRSSSGMFFALEHRKRKRRRLTTERMPHNDKRVSDVDKRVKCIEEIRQNHTEGVDTSGSNLHKDGRISLPKWLSSNLLVLIPILLIAQTIIGATATTLDPLRNSTGDNKENLQNSIELFTNKIWRLQEPVMIDERMASDARDWQALLKNTKNKAMCHVWNADSPTELCTRSRWPRLRRMRELSLFTHCPEGFANLQLIDIFHLNWRHIRTEEDLLSHSDHLRAGSEGQSCLMAPADSHECLDCFNKLKRTLERLEKAFWSFSNLLLRFDCREIIKKQQREKELSATRPFSPNTTCYNCAEWYRKWLLVNLVSIWKKKPCINWCYYTQLACPHLATNKVVEFAGHPVFLCRDQRLSKEAHKNSDCACLHPCDLIQTRIAQFLGLNKTDDGASSFDFFHVSTFCQGRETFCGDMNI